jgi:chromosome segregation ATPase
LSELAAEVMALLNTPKDVEETCTDHLARRQVSAAMDLVDQATHVIRIGADRIEQLEASARRTEEENRALLQRVMEELKSAEVKLRSVEARCNELESCRSDWEARAVAAEARAIAAEARLSASQTWRGRLQAILNEWASAPDAPAAFSTIPVATLTAVESGSAQEAMA